MRIREWGACTQKEADVRDPRISLASAARTKEIVVDGVAHAQVRAVDAERTSIPESWRQGF